MTPGSPVEGSIVSAASSASSRSWETDPWLAHLIDVGVFQERDVVGVRTLPRRPPKYADGFPRGLHPDVVGAVRRSGIHQLFAHQALAIEQILAGQDVVLVSPTATGKTLCFNLPVLSRLASAPHRHALYLYPTKALAHDQLLALKAITEHLPVPHSISSWPFDGDTGQDERRLLKEQPPDIVITNPDAVHHSILGWNEQWLSLLRTLDFIVVDEAHEYRGFFGTNVAYVLRRLLALCQRLGSHPQLIFASATAANPEEHARALSGRSAVVLRSEDTPQPERHFVFINPEYPEFRYEEVLVRRLADLAVESVAAKRATLVFCPTRRMVERVAKMARRAVAGRGFDGELVAPYKAGYTADERRRIEKQLKAGETLVVFATNALELGIDMGRLDAIVMVGFPDTVMSAWQRAGRAGRSWDREAHVMFIASRRPVDQFYVENIDLFMNRDLDRLAINLENEEVIKPHALCAIFEAEGQQAALDPTVLGEPLVRQAASLAPDLSMLRRLRPHRRVDLRSVSGQTYVIKVGEEEIGTISGEALFTEAYIGAIYDHYGHSYRVRSHGAREVMVEHNEQPHYTKPTRFSTIVEQAVVDGRRWMNRHGEVRLFFGRVEVSDHLTGYREYDERSDDLVDEVEYESHQVKSYRTDAVWIELQDPGEWGSLYRSAHSLEHGFKQTAPLMIPCDPFDLAGLTQRLSDGRPKLFIYDAVKGGIGIAREIFAVFPQLVEKARGLMEGCQCEDRCPRCILMSRCHDPSGELNRRDGATLASRLSLVLAAAPERYDPETYEWRP
jgi:DEAD/DEAH box helicase domain-containing protein